MGEATFEDKLIWLLNISRKMLATRDINQLLELITDAFIELCGADRGCLFLKRRETGELKARTSRSAERVEMPTPEHRILNVARQVVKDGHAIFASETDKEEENPQTKRSFQELQLKMMVCVPLPAEHSVCGALYADGKNHGAGVFDARSHKVSELLAEHAAAAIENARMFERATNDPLTGLPNSSAFLHQLAKVMREAVPNSEAGVLLLDLDNFKRINSAAGAEMGDRALVDIATTLQEVLRADGLVARYGSDKFAVLLPPDENTKIALRLRDVAERARASVATKTYHGVKLTASIGGVGYPGPKVSSAPDLVALADDVLGRARARGGGEVEIDQF